MNRYGVLGRQIAIDVHGNVIPWDKSKDTAGFRDKVEKLRRALDRSRRPRYGVSLSTILARSPCLP